jgi:hypothetical protein
MWRQELAQILSGYLRSFGMTWGTQIDPELLHSGRDARGVVLEWPLSNAPHPVLISFPMLENRRMTISQFILLHGQEQGWLRFQH